MVRLQEFPEIPFPGYLALYAAKSYEDAFEMESAIWISLQSRSFYRLLNYEWRKFFLKVREIFYERRMENFPFSS